MNGHSVSEKKSFHVHDPVVKKILKNGLTILVRPVHTVPKVSIQLWYNVGSKDEKDKERGIAHLIEHMIFKGTDRLSEGDIDAVVHKLSGTLNAFTSYDYTGYLFNFPSHHWREAFDIMADCMQNCSFKNYMLNSEMKAVIQELKMNRDKYTRSLFDQMMSAIFHDHPYHHPIIGYKQDLWSVKSDDLRKFYAKHYIPNNATLVVVGDVDPEDVFEEAEKYFGAIPANPHYKKEKHYHSKDIASKTVTLHRAIEQPVALYCYAVPGTEYKKDASLELLSRIIGKGRGSRLYNRLVNEEQLATSVSASYDDLFEYGLFFIVVEPKCVDDLAKIEAIINQEIETLKHKGFSDLEFQRALKKTEMDLLSIMESFESQAYEIGKYFVATGDENYLFNFLSKDKESIKKEMHQILHSYFRQSLLHRGFVLPIDKNDNDMWMELQQQSDKEDSLILQNRTRTEPIESPSFVQSVEVQKPKKFNYPKASITQLSNGLKVLYYKNDNTPKVDIILDFKAKHFYDPKDKEGLAFFVSKMLLEGTKKYSAKELTDLIESRGMSISPYTGGISLSCLSDDLAFGLELLFEILKNASFPEDKVEKVRNQLKAQISQFWDEPTSFSRQLIREVVYGDHPYSKNSIGTKVSIGSITRDDLIAYYNTYISPMGARLALVGDFNDQTLKSLLEKYLGEWKRGSVQDVKFPVLKEIVEGEQDYPINRDQVCLKFAALSVDRLHPDYDKLLLFDQIFGGGALGSMHSRLFKLREQSGLFYTIAGSVIAGSDEQPGMLLVQTIVSLDRLKEAEQSIKHVITTAADNIEDEEFEEARRGLIDSQIDYFTSNYGIASAFLFIDRYNFSQDFFDERAQKLAHITAQDSADAAKKLLCKNLITLRVGRVGQS